MSDHNSWTPWPICLKFWVGNSVDLKALSWKDWLLKWNHWFKTKLGSWASWLFIIIYISRSAGTVVDLLGSRASSLFIIIYISRSAGTVADLLQRPALDARLPSIAERSVNTKIGRTITGCAGFRRKYLLIILNSSLANQITARRANRSGKIQDPLKIREFFFGF